MQDFKSTLFIIIGERIKAKRKEQGMSQNDLSKHLKLGRSSISNIEIGRHQVPLSVLYEISQILKVSINYFIPPVEEVIQTLNSEKKEYSKILNSKKLNKDERDSVKEILNNL